MKYPLLLCLLLAGCGGSGGGSTPPSTGGQPVVNWSLSAPVTIGYTPTPTFGITVTTDGAGAFATAVDSVDASMHSVFVPAGSSALILLWQPTMLPHGSAPLTTPHTFTVTYLGMTKTVTINYDIPAAGPVPQVVNG